jgi:hypothetical protein
MTDKDKTEQKTEAQAAPKLTPKEIAAELLRLYSHAMETASPRTIEELKLIQELVAAK